VCVAAPAGWHVFLQLMWEVGLPPSPVDFSWLCHSHNLSCSWLLGMRLHLHPLRPSPVCLFKFREGFPSPPSVLRAPHPLCYMSLLFLLLITQFLFFPWVGGLSVQGAMPRVVCGSTVYRLAHLVCVFTSHLDVGVWQPGGPPGFSV
jgi:hypothetical protein